MAAIVTAGAAALNAAAEGGFAVERADPALGRALFWLVLPNWAFKAGGRSGTVSLQRVVIVLMKTNGKIFSPDIQPCTGIPLAS